MSTTATSGGEYFATPPTSPAKDQVVVAVERPAKKRSPAERCLKSGLRQVGSTQFWSNRFPFVQAARNYSLECLFGDIAAGITMALTIIPQSIGYAPLAGLPLQFGLYSSLLPGFLYAFLGSCREVSIGPTAVQALMSYNYAGPNAARAATLGFFSGMVEILAGLVNLGFLINFISAPVISAFTSAVSIQVGTSQVKGLFGLQVPGRGFVTTWRAVFEHMTEIRACDSAVGFSCLGILLFLRNMKDYHWCEGRDLEAPRARFFAKFKWLVSISRNCLVVIISSLVAYYLVEVKGWKDVLIITGEVDSGVPPFQLPWLTASPLSPSSPSSNATLAASASDESPLDMAMDMGSGLIMLPLTSVLQMLAIVKFYSPAGRKVAASQEILALGTCQVAGSFLGSFTVTSAFSRSAVNSVSGVRTPFSGVVTSGLLLLSCALLTPYLAYIPTAALSAVIISAMVFNIDVDILLPLWRAKKIDLIPFCLTFFLGLFVSVESGMIVGTLAHLIILLYCSSRPTIRMQKGKIDNVCYHLVIPDRGLFFPSVDKIRSYLNKTSLEIEIDADGLEGEGQGQDKGPIEAAMALAPVIVDMSQVVEMDYTAAKAIRVMAKQMKKSGQNIYFCNVKEEIEEILQGVDPSLFLSYVNVRDAEMKIRGS